MISFRSLLIFIIFFFSWRINYFLIHKLIHARYSSITLNYTFTCLNSESGPDYKFILFTVTLQNVLTFYKKVNLFNVTSDNSTLMTYEFYDFSNQSNEYIDLLKEQTSYDVGKLDKFLQTSTIGFFQNESTVINLPIESLWNRVLSHDLIKELFKGYFSPLQHINKEGKIDNNTSEELYRTVGEIFKIFYLKENAIYVEVKEVSNVKNEIKREVLLSIYNNNICITKEIRLTFIQIDEGKSYFSMCHYFTAPDSPDSIKQLGSMKRKMLQRLKKLLED